MSDIINYGKYQFKLPKKETLIKAFLNAGNYTNHVNNKYKYNNDKVNYEDLIKLIRKMYKIKYNFMKKYQEQIPYYKRYLKDDSLNPVNLSDEELVNLGSEYHSIIKDKEEAEVFREAISPVYLQDMDYKYVFDYKNPEFIHFFANKMQQMNCDPQIRIYLNLKAGNAVKFADRLIKHSIDNKMLPYFKLSTNYRIDEFIMYVEEKNVEKYLDILTEMKKENPKLCELAGDMDINLAKYDNWIGIGEEVEEA